MFSSNSMKRKQMLYLFLSFISILQGTTTQLVVQNVTRGLKYQVDEQGRISFIRNIFDKSSQDYKIDSNYTFILEKIRELSEDKTVIKSAKNLTFNFIKKRELTIFNQNVTILTFSSSSKQDDKSNAQNSLDSNTLLQFDIYQYQSSAKEKRGSDLHNSRQISIKFNLTNYEFCKDNSTKSLCIDKAATNSTPATYKNGNFLEFEFSFSSNGNKPYKIFNDQNPGNTQSGDFIYYISSEIDKDGQVKAVDSNEIVIESNSTILRVSQFSKSLSFGFNIDTFYSDGNNIPDDAPAKDIILKSSNATNEVSINIKAKGGLVELNKLQQQNSTKSVNLSIVGIYELDEKLNELKEFNGVYHYIPNFSNLVLKTDDFKSDSYQNLDVLRSRVLLKGNPTTETEIALDIIVFKKKGSLKIDYERKVDVKAGDIKIKFEVTNWPFCRWNSFASAQNCPITNQPGAATEGKYLRFRIAIQGKEIPNLMPYSTDKFTLGDVSYIFTSYFNIDDKISKIEKDGFTENEDQNNKIMYNFTYPIFAKKASIEVFFNMDTPSGPIVILIILIGLFSLLSAGFIIFNCISKKMKHSRSAEAGLL